MRHCSLKGVWGLLRRASDLSLTLPVTAIVLMMGVKEEEVFVEEVVGSGVELRSAAK